MALIPRPRDGFLLGPLRRGRLADAVEDDGENDDGQTRFHRLPHLKGAQGEQHVIAEPPAPIIEEMITMLSASMMTWLTPSISDGLALGTSTRHSFWRRVQPAMSAKSLTSCGTLARPRTVARTIGGVAKRPVARSAETGLLPKSSSIGMR